jgi:hypothetical protein
MSFQPGKLAPSVSLENFSYQAGSLCETLGSSQRIFSFFSFLVLFENCKPPTSIALQIKVSEAGDRNYFSSSSFSALPASLSPAIIVQLDVIQFIKAQQTLMGLAE